VRFSPSSPPPGVVEAWRAISDEEDDMKVRFWVVSAKGQSLRESLNNDLDKDRSRPEEKMKYPVRLQKEHKIDRSPGWSWVHSRQGGKGAITEAVTK